MNEIVIAGSATLLEVCAARKEAGRAYLNVRVDESQQFHAQTSVAGTLVMRVNSAQTLRGKRPPPRSSSSLGMRLNVVTPLRQSESGTQFISKAWLVSCGVVGTGAPIMFGGPWPAEAVEH